MHTPPPPEELEPRLPGQDSGTGERPSNLRFRILAFAVFCLACLAAAGAYVIRAVLREKPSTESFAHHSSADHPAGRRFVPPAGPSLLFTNLASGPGDRNRAAVVPLELPEGPREMTRLACQRVHFAGGRGICLGEGGGTAPLDDDVISTHAYVFAADLQISHDLSLGGFPTRVRVSPDGRYGAVTVFVAGHSYAEAGFSTATTLLDLERGTKLGNLEQFALWRDGKRVRAIDVNFWGVTFAPGGDRFYATVATSGRTYLVEGSVGERQMRTLRENVECPSVSPDGKRLAFKKRDAGFLRAVWRFHVLDLATMAEIPLAEPRSIDDQIEWLDDRRVLYGDGRTIWVAAADGTGQPHKFLTQASSPVVLGTALAAAGGGSGEAARSSLTLRAADLAVAITGSAADIPAAGEVRYTVRVSNHGPADATKLRVDHLLPADATLVGAATATNPGQGYGCALHEDQRRVSCDTVLLPNGQSWTLTLNVRAGAAGTLSTRVVVSGAEPDPNPGNDSAVAETTVHPPGK